MAKTRERPTGVAVIKVPEDQGFDFRCAFTETRDGRDAKVDPNEQVVCTVPLERFQELGYDPKHFQMLLAIDEMYGEAHFKLALLGMFELGYRAGKGS